ncbi:putative Saccharopine dehydrogenase [Glarea lozoyensis 74030]|uniref:Putative Saccharopine dehydrogenase n=1 Tax=Glarea lozoyensis (strain ATCC 74030 / MF5533) TaxID=1104152 RepID=H0EP22_GLAL7|nr:putative Saccharopine dehydrogenase [Glarea lozoyensis 74030]
MSFQPGERDLVMLQHKFVVEWADGKEAVFTSTLELLGKPGGYSAMSLSVGVTCGIATQLLLDGHPALNVPGVLAPYTKEICDPIRDLLEQEGVKMVEKQVS